MPCVNMHSRSCSSLLLPSHLSLHLSDKPQHHLTPSPEASRLAQLRWGTWHQTQSCMHTQLMLFLASLHHICVCMLMFDRRLGLCSVYARAFREGFTVTLVSGRTVGIGAYLARLGRRSVKMHLTINMNSNKGSCQY